MGGLEQQLRPVLTPILELLRDTRVWGILILCLLFIYSIELVEGYVAGPWPHQRRGDDRFDPLAPGSRSAWMAVAILLMPGLLLAVVIAVVRFAKQLPTGFAGLPIDGLHGVGLGLVLFAWAVFVAGKANLLQLNQYLRRVGLITPAALLVCLMLGDLMLLLSLIEATR
jgi:hypothetical protein